MGGCGSGRWYRWETKTLVTSCRSLDVRRLHREGLLQPDTFCGWAWLNSAGEQEAYIGVQVAGDGVKLTYRYRFGGGEWQDVREPVDLSWTPCNYGGRRPWFRCPGVVSGISCSRRVLKLYLAGQYFLCRHCYALAYPSQRVLVADRPMTRAQDIRMRLGGSGSLCDPFPEKPKRMHWATYLRLWDKAQKAELESVSIIAARLRNIRRS